MTVSFDKAEGSRAEVFHGTAKHTSGGLVKSALLMNKHGRIVSSKKHNSAKREKRLLKHGYGTKKGKFGFVRIKAKGTRKHKSRKHKGGSGIHQALGSAPVKFSGSDESAGMGYQSNDSVGIQEAAGMSGGRRTTCCFKVKKDHCGSIKSKKTKKK